MLQSQFMVKSFSWSRIWFGEFLQDLLTKTGAESELITSTSKIYDSILFYEEFLQFQNKNFYDLCTECMIFYYILDNLPSLTFKTFIQYDTWPLVMSISSLESIVIRTTRMGKTFIIAIVVLYIQNYQDCL